jgi:L-lactate dehydrogenase complex protein LldG
MSDARDAIFAAVRANLARSAPLDAHEVAVSRPAPAVAAREDEAARTARFCDELTAVAGHCSIARGRDEAVEAIERILVGTGARRVAVSDAALVRDLVAGTSACVEWVDDPSRDELFDCDVGITSAQWGVAETGTLVLESDAERHRLISLVPRTHIAVVEADRILATLGEALARVHSADAADVSRTITFVTGPSRTADIELTLAIGVHGPQHLYAVVLRRT